MNTGSLTREHKLFIAAGGSALFVISLFISWFGVESFSVSGMDVVPSAWIFLIFGIVAAAVFAADALNYELPLPFSGLLLGTYLASVNVILTVAIFLEGSGGGRKIGLFLALIGTIVSLVGAVLASKESR